MKLKSLSILIILFTILSFTACLDSDEEYEYSSNDVISFFALPDILGKQYFFTIDQIGGNIYNRDSLPFCSDTIINKILIKQINYVGYITSGDTLFNYLADSVDLRKPLEITSHAPDGLYKRDYKIKVNVHQQDPDSLCWTKLNTTFANQALKGEHKTIIFKDRIKAYNKEQVFSSPLSDGTTWENEPHKGFPSASPIKLQTLTSHNDKIYAINIEGDLYSSEDGATFTKEEELSKKKIITLLYGRNEELYAVIKETEENEEKLYFAGVNLKTSSWNKYNLVNDAFPLENLSVTQYTTSTGTERVVIAGKPSELNNPTTPWFSSSGQEWYEMKSDNKELNCPYINNPTIIYYNSNFYMFGEPFEDIYSSREAINWRITESKFLYPTDFNKRTNYSMIVDENGYLWITWGDEDEVWRGRVNKLGFENQKK